MEQINMINTLWLAIIAIALGTYLMRALPLVWMTRKLDKNKSNTTEEMPIWLTVLGPAMIAAMFGTSLIPSSQSITTWLATALGALVTAVIWYWKRSLGLPVLIGVMIYGISIYFARLYLIY